METHINKIKSEIELMADSERPAWLPLEGTGMRNLEPVRWSMSIAQWIFFIRWCTTTKTWELLVNSKTPYTVNMHDIVTYFVKPWTAGTGCSIALLMNSKNECPPRKVELMISHAWSGSVFETYNSLQYIVNHGKVPVDTPLFFCALCLYQPEDKCAKGLSIQEQLILKPFAKIIESKPSFGMWVVHTTMQEVYTRMWTVHEVDEAIIAQCPIQGAFDFYVFKPNDLLTSSVVRCEEAECLPEDKAMLTELINSRGGFERLDAVITKFRRTMKTSFETFLSQNRQTEEGKMIGGYMNTDYVDFSNSRTNKIFDWQCVETDSHFWQGFDEISKLVTWDFDDRWKKAVSDVTVSLSSRLSSPDHRPLGNRSFPFGDGANR
jgi:hypothetical protein